jgi:hypothetical protein
VKKRRYSAGGGVPVTGGGYNAVAPQYPFPSVPGGDAGATNNMSVTVAGQEVGVGKQTNPFKNPDAEPAEEAEGTKQMRRGGKVKSKRVRGDGIAQRGRTKGRFV